MAKAVVEQSSISLQPGGSLGGYFAGIWHRTSTFISDVRGEMKKVVAPSWPDVQSTTIVVLITVALFALYFYALDSILGKAIHWSLQRLSGQ